VQVLHHEHHGSILGETRDEGGDLLEQHGLSPFVIGGTAGMSGQEPDQFRPEPGVRLVRTELSGEIAEQSHQRRERKHRLRELEALPFEGQGGGVVRQYPTKELVHQPGLADAGLAPEQHHRQRPGRRPGPTAEKRTQLILAADQDRGLDAG